MTGTPGRKPGFVEYRIIGPDEATVRAVAAEQPGLEPGSIRVRPTRDGDRVMLYAAITALPAVPEST